MEFTVNEAGCRQLSIDMMTTLRDIAKLVKEIENNNNLLRSALGEDYESIARTVRVMAEALGQAEGEMNTVIHNMEEYIRTVGLARIALQ